MKKIVWLIVILLALAPTGAVRAHSGEPLTLGNAWEAWNWNLPILLGIALPAWLYTRGLGKVRERTGQLGRAHRWQAAAFWSGLALVFAALVSPIDALGEVLFSAHMVQHMVLILLAAPLLVLGAPTAPLLLSLPPDWSRAAGRAWSPLRRSLGWLAHPAVAWGLHLAAILAWHVPGLYQAALENELVHILEHLSFLGTALLFWQVTFRHYGAKRSLQGAAVLYVFTMMVASGMLGALLTFSSSPWIPAYAETTRAWGLSPLEDQQLAGVIMWVPAGMVYLVVGLVMFGRWIGRAEQAHLGGLMVLLALLLSACGGGPADFRSDIEAAPVAIPNSDPERGRQLLRDYGCISCHSIPGIPGADTLVGPPLNGWAERHYIAGRLDNNPENLMYWIQEPQTVEPGNAMPDMDVPEPDARDMAAYLFSLRGED